MSRPMNQEGTIFASAARTSTPTPSAIENPLGAAILTVFINTTAASTPSTVFTIQGYDPASDSWYDILASAAVTGTGATRLRVGPGLAATNNVSAPDVVPPRFRVTATHGNANSHTYTVGYALSRA